MLFMKAVNKLAEIMNRKEVTSSRGQRGKVNESDMRKKEKERRKLEQELKQVWTLSLHFSDLKTVKWTLELR